MVIVPPSPLFFSELVFNSLNYNKLYYHLIPDRGVVLQDLLQSQILPAFVITNLTTRKGFFPPYKLAVLKSRNEDLLKRWFVEFYAFCEASDKLVRKVIYIPSKKYPSPKERRAFADAVIKQVNKELIGGGFLARQLESVDMGKLVGEYLNYRLASKMTVKEYRTTLQACLLPWMKGEGLSTIQELTPEKITAFLDQLQAQKAWGNVTRNAKRQHISSFFGWAMARGFLDQSPIGKVKTEKEIQTPRFYPFSDADMQLILEHLGEHDPQLKIFCQMIYYCFLRPGRELRLLRVGDVMVREKKIRVRAEIAKNRKTQFVRVPNKCLEMLIDLGWLNKPSSLYLFGRDGEPGKSAHGRDMMTRRFRAVLDHLGYDQNYSLYSWKHTGCCALYRKKKDIKLIREQCRHASIEETDRYLRSLGLYAEDSALDDF